MIAISRGAIAASAQSKFKLSDLFSTLHERARHFDWLIAYADARTPHRS